MVSEETDENVLSELCSIFINEELDNLNGGASDGQ